MAKSESKIDPVQVLSTKDGLSLRSVFVTALLKAGILGVHPKFTAKLGKARSGGDFFVTEERVVVAEAVFPNEGNQLAFGILADAHFFILFLLGVSQSHPHFFSGNSVNENVGRAPTAALSFTFIENQKVTFARLKSSVSI